MGFSLKVLHNTSRKHFNSNHFQNKTKGKLNQQSTKKTSRVSIKSVFGSVSTQSVFSWNVFSESVYKWIIYQVLV